MEDHHVDRPEVEAWQHVELTGTNGSNALRFAHPMIEKPGPVPPPWRRSAPAVREVIAPGLMEEPGCRILSETCPAKDAGARLDPADLVAIAPLSHPIPFRTRS